MKIVYGLSIGDKSGDLASTFSYFSGEQNFFATDRDISHTFFGARQNLAALGGWPIETYSPNFVNFSAGVP